MALFDGRILMPSDLLDTTIGDATLHEAADGTLVQQIPSPVDGIPVSGKVPYCLVGDVLPNGRWMVPYEDINTFSIGGLAIYDSAGNLVTTITSPFAGMTDPACFVRSDHDAYFYVVAYDDNGGGLDGSLYKIDQSGNIIQTWANILSGDRVDIPTLSLAHQLDGFAIKYDGSVAYFYLGTFAPAKIYTYNTGSDTWDATELISISSRRGDLDGLILTAGGTKLLVSARAGTGVGNMIRYLYLYDLAGAQLATVTLGSTGDPTEIGAACDDDDNVWAKVLGNSALTYTVYKLSSTDLSTVLSWGGNTLENGGLVPASCPLLVFGSPTVIQVPAEPVNLEPVEYEPPDSICDKVSRRLGDEDHRIWSAVEIDNYLAQGVREMCTFTRLIWDWVYPENLPRGFSYNHAFELALIDGTNFGFKYGPGDGMGTGRANYTAEFERRLWDDQLNGAPTGRSEDYRDGWARHTFPDELPWLTILGSDQLQAVSDLPHRLTEVERSTWDKRTIDADIHRNHRYEDSQYESRYGEVEAYTWRKDGPRAYRKIRVPAALADYYEIDSGSALPAWGIARDVTDLDYVGDSVDIEGTWGIPRRVPGEHPIGPRHTREPWGTPRRFYRDGTNVRVEHWRIAYFDCFETELPERYRNYLVWFAMWKALTRQSPGQDMKLAGWYQQRWLKGLARIKNRIGRQQNERTGRLGGADPAPNTATRPPRPRLPWQYGKRVR
jgi:hypothetical protein